MKTALLFKKRGGVPTWTLTPINAAARIAAGQMTFSRGTLATQVNADGSIGWAPHNLVTWSIDFSNAAWSKLQQGTGVAPIVTPGQPDAFGGNTAARIQFNLGATPSGAASRIFQGTGANSGRTGRNAVWLRTNDGTTATLGMTGSGDNQPITVTPTWQQFVMTGSDAFMQIQFGLYSNGTATSADVLACAPQVNVGPLQPYYPTTGTAYHGLRVADYSDDTPIGSLGPEAVQAGGLTIPAGTTANLLGTWAIGDTLRVIAPVLAGLYVYNQAAGGWSNLGVQTVVAALANSLTFYNSTGSPVTIPAAQLSVCKLSFVRVNPGIKIEPSATNLLLQSEDCTVSPWTVFGTATLSKDTVMGMNATKVLSALGATGGAWQGCVASANTYTFSRIIDFGTLPVGAIVRMQVNHTGGGGYGLVDVDRKAALSNLAGTANQSAQAWVMAPNVVRVALTVTFASAGTLQAYVFQNANGDGVAFFKITAAQLETGSVATSYIPTSGSAATRGADDHYQAVASMAGLANVGGTLVVDGVAVNPSTAYAVQFRDGGSSNIISPWQNNNAAQIVQGGIGRAAAAYSLTNQAVRRRQAMAWGATSAALAIDGVARTITQPSVVPTKAELTRLEVTPSFNGTIYNLAYYPIAIDPNRLMLATTPKLGEYLAATWSIRPGSIPAGGTFSRGTLATVVNADGSISLAPHNLMPFSDNMTGSGWFSSGSAVRSVSGVTLPGDFSSNAAIAIPVTPGRALTLRVKLSGTGVVGLRIQDNAGAFGSNTTQVTLTSTPTDYTVSYTPLQSSVVVGLWDYGAASNVTAVNWQVNVGPVQPFYPTSGTAFHGLRNQDYSDNPLVPGIKLEGAATNLITQSVPASSGTLTVSEVDVITLGTLTLKASTVSGTNQGRIETIQIPANSTVTASAFFKRKTSRYAGIGVYTGQNICALIDFNTETVAVYGVAAGFSLTPILKKLGASVFRLEVTFVNTTGAGSTTGIKFGIPTEFTSSMDLATGADSCYLGGLQVETGTFATSYIPTAGSTATRAADVWSYPTTAVSGWGGVQGTLVARAEAKSGAALSLDGTPSWLEKLVLRYVTDSVVVRNAAGNIVASAAPALSGAKTAASFSPSGSQVANAGAVSALGAGKPDFSAATFTIGQDVTASKWLNGTLYALDFYPQALPANLLQDLTK